MMDVDDEGGDGGGERRVLKEVDVYFGDVKNLLLRPGRQGGQQKQQQQGGGGGGGGGGEAQGEATPSAQRPGMWSQIVLLQYPLRPQDRPYPTSAAEAVRVKPINQRVEVDIPISHECGNYDGDHRPAMAGTTAGRSKVSCLTLRSSDIALETNYMVGMEQAGRLVLLPLDRAVQMRPHNAYLDRSQEGERAEASGAAAAAQPKGAAVGGGVELMTVQIQRHETQRQLEARQQSHAYLREVEEREAWSSLKVWPIGSTGSSAVRRAWRRNDRAAAADPAAPSSSSHANANANVNAAPAETNAMYLSRLVPREGGAPAAPGVASGGWGAMHAAAREELTSACRELLLRGWMGGGAPVSVSDVRRGMGDAMLCEIDDAGALTAGQLHAAVAATGLAIFVFDRFFPSAFYYDASGVGRKHAKGPRTKEEHTMRGLVLTMLAEAAEGGEGLRRSAVMRAASLSPLNLNPKKAKAIYAAICLGFVCEERKPKGGNAKDPELVLVACDSENG